eukprot:6935939-Ditylum_brightwellii.AAC.1
MKALMQHPCYIKGTIHLKNQELDTTQRLNNNFIMETAYQSKVIPAGWLTLMNYCCMYFQVQTVAHTSSSDGKGILQRNLHKDTATQHQTDIN